MRSMPTPLSDTLRVSREVGVEAAIQRIQQLLFRNHSPDRSMVELASRRNKYTHITSSRQQVCCYGNNDKIISVVIGTGSQFGTIGGFAADDT